MIDKRFDNVPFDEVVFHAVRGFERSIELLEHLNWKQAQILEWFLAFVEADLDEGTLAEYYAIQARHEAGDLRRRLDDREREGHFPEQYPWKRDSERDKEDGDSQTHTLEGEPQ
jgi:hypothetical protein